MAWRAGDRRAAELEGLRAGELKSWRARDLESWRAVEAEGFGQLEKANGVENCVGELKNRDWRTGTLEDWRDGQRAGELNGGLQGCRAVEELES